MKILLITSLYPGYTNQKSNEVPYVVHYFAQEWNKMGHDLKVVRPWVIYPNLINFIKKAKKAKKYDINESLNIDNIDVNRYKIKKIPKVDYSNKSIKEIYTNVKSIVKNEFTPDIILCHMINPSLYIGSLLKKEFNIPLVLTIHTGDIEYLQRTTNMKKYKKIKSTIDKVGFRSEKLKKEYNKLFSEENNEEEQPIIYSGINKRFIIDKSYLATKILKKNNRIFVAANLIPLKNIDIIIEAFSKINNKELILEIAGDGPEKEKLVELTKESQMKDNILFLGRLEREEVLRKMKESDIFVLVSAPETFGLVYLEAMASGCIVIGSRGEGIDGVINDGENGYLCTPSNIDELANIFNKVINLSGASKTKVLSNAVATAEKMTQEEMSTKYLEVLKDVVNDPSIRRS